MPRYHAAMRFPRSPEREARQLAQRAAGGDEGAWREIYTETRERLFGLLVYQIGDRDEALDLLQETYLSAVKGIDRYEGRGTLSAWLTGIAVRRALDWKRRVLVRMKRTVGFGDAGEMDFPVSDGDPEQRRALQRELSSLSARQRAAVLLHEWMGYSFQEIGKILGTSESTARVHAHRGRETLRTRLSGAGDETTSPAAQEERS